MPVKRIAALKKTQQPFQCHTNDSVRVRLLPAGLLRATLPRRDEPQSPDIRQSPRAREASQPLPGEVRDREAAPRTRGHCWNPLSEGRLTVRVRVWVSTRILNQSQHFQKVHLKSTWPFDSLKKKGFWFRDQGYVEKWENINNFDNHRPSWERKESNLRLRYLLGKSNAWESTSDVDK